MRGASRASHRHVLALGPRTVTLGPQPWLLGIVNVTPDSFSDGGRFLDPAAAVAQGRALIAEGADCLDVGGESTRPGAAPVTAAAECERVVPVIAALAAAGPTPVSVDTSKAAVAAAACAAGATCINDVTAGTGDPGLLDVAASTGAALVLMHMQGTPRTMQQAPHYDDVVDDVRRYLEARLEAARRAGVRDAQLLVDPGLGFGKTLAHNLALQRHLDALHALGRPVLLGPSRKSFLGALLDAPVDARLEGTLAACVAAVLAGAAALRVHDVGPTRRAVRVATAIRDGVPA
jgi:dihydropteroate synthase